MRQDYDPEDNPRRPVPTQPTFSEPAPESERGMSSVSKFVLAAIVAAIAFYLFS